MSQFFVLTVSCCVFSCLTISSATISCGSDIYLSAGTRATISSPNYPSKYPSGICRKWRITAPSGKRVKLKFISFDLYGYPTCSKSSDDTLKIYDSTTPTTFNLLGSYCGNYIPADVVSSGRYLYLVFYSNYKTSPADKGFNLQYSAVSVPGGIDTSVCSQYNSKNDNKNIHLTATNNYKKYIQSPLYPYKYPSNIECIWYIKASSSNKKIKLTVTTMRIYNYNSQSCGSDFLKITDGSRTNDKTLKEMCSRIYSSETVTSSGQYMTVRFKTNLDNYFGAPTFGFYAEFIETENGATGIIVGAIFGCLIAIGLVVCCICIIKRRRTSGQVMRQAPPVTTATKTTTTTQYPMQPQAPLPPQGTYPQAGASYPPPAAGSSAAAPGSSYPPQGGYPPPGSSNPPPQGSYPPPGSSYPPPGSSYPPPAQGSYPPPSDPPPQYPGPPAYPPQPPFNPSQPNPPYPPAPQGGGASQQYPPAPQGGGASQPPPF